MKETQFEFKIFFSVIAESPTHNSLLFIKIMTISESIFSDKENSKMKIKVNPKSTKKLSALPSGESSCKFLYSVLPN